MPTSRKLILGVIGMASTAVLIMGWFLANPMMASGGAVGASYALLRLASTGYRRRKKSVSGQSSCKPVVKRRGEPVDPNDTDALVEQMLAQGRFALLLRPQVAGNLSDEQFDRAKNALEEAMGLVPEGDVVLGKLDDALDDGKLDDHEITGCNGRVIQVAHFFLDRYPVTNGQYYEFVAGGGYEQISLWDKEIWPAVLDFVDQTGEPGPAFWKNGCHEPRLENHPVVGVSWYEAGACARWLGKRLPSDAEWVKTGSWPLTISSRTRVQRKFPWGDAMDRTRANLWGSGPGHTVSVDEFATGVSVGGVYHLIGNVWEWTRGDAYAGDLPYSDLARDVPMRSIRGGAFDTYFDNQATCHFQSGESAMARKPNVGIRCAVGICDLVLARRTESSAMPAEPENAPVEEMQV